MSKVDLFFYPKNDVDVFSNISRATIHQMKKDSEISQKNAGSKESCRH